MAFPRDLGVITIGRLIIHEVPKHLHKDTTASPTFSEVESPLDIQLRIFLRDKIIETAGSSSAYEVVFNEHSTSPVPKLVKVFLEGTDHNLVGISKTIAQHLHNTQSGVNSGGLVTIVECWFSGDRALSILKLEKEEGVRLRRMEHEGRPTFDVQYIRELILTKNTKLFKIGLFTRDESGEIRGLTCDQQTGYLPKTEVATFFLATFLGCELRQDPRVATKRFFNAAQDFFNDKIEDPAVRTEALTSFTL